MAFPEPRQQVPPGSDPTAVSPSILTFFLSSLGVKAVHATSDTDTMTEEGLERVSALLQEKELAVLLLDKNFEIVLKKEGHLFELHAHRTSHASSQVWRKLTAGTPQMHNQDFTSTECINNNRINTAAADAAATSSSSSSSFLKETLDQAASTWQGIRIAPKDVHLHRPLSSFGISAPYGDMELPMVGAEKDREARAGEIFSSSLPILSYLYLCLLSLHPQTSSAATRRSGCSRKERSWSGSPSSASSTMS